MIGGRRANQLWAQSREPLNCRLDFDHTSVNGELCAHVENMQWATGGGDEGMLHLALDFLIIWIIVNLNIKYATFPTERAQAINRPTKLWSYPPSSPVNLLRHTGSPHVHTGSKTENSHMGRRIMHNEIVRIQGLTYVCVMMMLCEVRHFFSRQIAGDEPLGPCTARPPDCGMKLKLDYIIVVWYCSLKNPLHHINTSSATTCPIEHNCHAINCQSQSNTNQNFHVRAPWSEPQADPKPKVWCKPG